MGSNAGIKGYTLDINPTQLLQQGKNPGYMAIQQKMAWLWEMNFEMGMRVCGPFKAFFGIRVRAYLSTCQPQRMRSQSGNAQADNPYRLCIVKILSTSWHRYQVRTVGQGFFKVAGKIEFDGKQIFLKVKRVPVNSLVTFGSGYESLCQYLRLITGEGFLRGFTYRLLCPKYMPRVSNSHEKADGAPLVKSNIYL